MEEEEQRLASHYLYDKKYAARLMVNRKGLKKRENKVI
jgi:hypothetical protein